MNKVIVPFKCNYVCEFNIVVFKFEMISQFYKIILLLQLLTQGECNIVMPLNIQSATASERAASVVNREFTMPDIAVHEPLSDGQFICNTHSTNYNIITCFSN